MADPTTERDALLARIDMCFAHHRAYHGSGVRVLVDDLRALYDWLVAAEETCRSHVDAGRVLMDERDAALSRADQAEATRDEAVRALGNAALVRAELDAAYAERDEARERAEKADAAEASVVALRIALAEATFLEAKVARLVEAGDWLVFCTWHTVACRVDDCRCGLGERLADWSRAKEDPPAIMPPQFTRSATEPPKTPAEYDALRTLSAEALRALGLRPWDSPDKPDYMGLWLLPGGWYAHIPRDYPLVFIDGTRGLFAPGRTDNDIRYGCLVYGIIPAWVTSKRTLAGDNT